MRTPLMIATALAMIATPAMAKKLAPDEVFTDSNSHYLDMKTAISEAKRELKSDLARAHDEGDRIDAVAEYEAEVADAKKDFRKEMAERGIMIPRGQVIVEDGEVAMLTPR
ncbi:hypothetical protein [Sphingomonas sp.]|uniref:hypothetical protein n=1 Tax=Sphingomonas sp. TaxID=28214 RepID=UPI001EB0B855|nr:hypothetical protein [Sphingomonas sp.]MBX3594767.1 hypothetical protein [Sphingomonas sp.]